MMNFIVKEFTKTSMLIALILNLSVVANAAQSEENLITMVSEKDATGEVKKTYDEIRNAFGMVPNAMKHQSISPDILKNSWEYVKLETSNKNFSPKLNAMIRMLVGEQKSCHYCVGVNEGMILNMFKVSLAEVNAIKKDASKASLNKKDKAMLLFVLKATKNPKSTTKSDIDNLKKLGWAEKDIFEGVKLGATIISFTITLDTFKVSRD